MNKPKKNCDTCRWAGPDDCMDPNASWQWLDNSPEFDCRGWMVREKDRKEYEREDDDFPE